MRRVYYGWILTGALGVTSIVSYGTTVYLFGVLIVPMSEELGWSRGAIAGAYGLSLVLAGLFGVPVGRLVDRFGARAIMAIGSIVGGAALLGAATVQEVWQLNLVWGGAIGLSMAMTFYPVSMAVVAHWFQRKRGAAYAALTLLGGLGSIVVVPLAGWLVPQLGWRGTVTALATLQFAVALPLHALLVRRHPEDLGLRPDGDPPDAPREAQSPAAGLPLRAALRYPAFWALTVAGSLDQLAVMVLGAHGIAFIIDGGFDPILAASLVGLIALVSLPGRFILPALSDRLGPRLLLGSCLCVQALGVAVLIRATTEVWLWVFVAIYGLAYGTRLPLRASLMADHFGRRAFASITAVQGIPIAVASALGPWAAGLLYDALGDYQFAFWLTAGAYCLAGLIVIASPRPRPIALTTA